MLIRAWGRLYQFYLLDVLFLVAVTAAEGAVRFVHHMEDGLHRFVVGDANRVVALHDAAQFIGSLHRLLLHHFVVVDDVEDDVGGNHREAGNLSIAEETVADLDDAFAAYFRGGIVVAYRHG